MFLAPFSSVFVSHPIPSVFPYDGELQYIGTSSSLALFVCGRGRGGRREPIRRESMRNTGPRGSLLVTCMYVGTSACIYVCMYVCMHACMYVCMYVCMHVCMYVTCMYVCMYVCMHVCMYVCTYVCMYACMYIIYTYIHAYVYIYIYIYIYLFFIQNGMYIKYIYIYIY